MNDQELAVSLKKQQRTKLQKQAVPPLMQKQQIEEGLALYKKELERAILEKNRGRAVSMLKQLIGLRARLVSLAVDETRMRQGKIGPEEINRHIGNYMIDCRRLLRAASQSLGEHHARA